MTRNSWRLSWHWGRNSLPQPSNRRESVNQLLMFNFARSRSHWQRCSKPFCRASNLASYHTLSSLLSGATGFDDWTVAMRSWRMGSISATTVGDWHLWINRRRRARSLRKGARARSRRSAGKHRCESLLALTRPKRAKSQVVHSQGRWKTTFRSLGLQNARSLQTTPVSLVWRSSQP